MDDFWLAFVPLFVAVDALGVLPLFLGLTHRMEAKDVRRAVYRSVLAATVIALVFAGLGSLLLELLGVTVEDFMIAGGLLLMALALRELLTEKDLHQRVDVNAAGVGVVPLGVPLITGPAVLTTSMLLTDQYGLYLVAGAIVANMLFAGFVFRFGALVRRILGSSGASVLSKIANLIMAALGVMMVRQGLVGLFADTAGQAV
ncbi:MAG: MarC family protein [Rhodocyclaceae bacterium]